MTTNPPKFDLGSIAAAILQPLVQQAVDAATEPLVKRLAILEEVLALSQDGEGRLTSLRLDQAQEAIDILDKAMAPVSGTGAGSLHDTRKLILGAHEKIERIHKDLDERVQNQGQTLQRHDMAIKGLADRLEQRSGDDTIDIDQIARDLEDNDNFRDSIATIAERTFDKLVEGGNVSRMISDAVGEQLKDGDHDEHIKEVLAGTLEDLVGALRE